MAQTTGKAKAVGVSTEECAKSKTAGRAAALSLEDTVSGRLVPGSRMSLDLRFGNTGVSICVFTLQLQVKKSVTDRRSRTRMELAHFSRTSDLSNPHTLP